MGTELGALVCEIYIWSRVRPGVVRPISARVLLPITRSTGLVLYRALDEGKKQFNGSLSQGTAPTPPLL